MLSIKRKVIQIANSTQLVSLPRKWALRNGVKKGDEIDVKEDGNKIIVSTEAQEDNEKTTLNLTTAEKFLRRSLDVLYRYGYDEVEVKYEDPAIVELLQKSTNELLGFEIVSQGPNSCIIKNIASGAEADFGNVLRRLFIMIDSMLKDCYSYIESKDYESLKKIKHFDTVINKFTNFSERILNKKGYKEFKKTSFMYFIVCGLEQISDELREMSDYLYEASTKSKSKVMVSREVLDIYKLAQEHFGLFYKMFYSGNKELLYEKKQKRIEIHKRINQVMESGKGVDNIIAKHIHGIVNNVQHMSIMVV